MSSKFLFSHLTLINANYFTKGALFSQVPTQLKPHSYFEQTDPKNKPKQIPEHLEVLSCLGTSWQNLSAYPFEIPILPPTAGFPSTSLD